jgi:hypothetical protein
MPPIRQAEADRGKAGNHFGAGSQPESAATRRDHISVRGQSATGSSFGGTIKKLFRAVARAVITDPAPKPIRRKGKGGEDTGRAAFKMAASIVHRASHREPLRPEHAVIAEPSSKNDIINWLRAQGYSWAAIRDLFPGFFPDEPPAPDPAEAERLFFWRMEQWETAALYDHFQQADFQPFSPHFGL